MLMKKIRTLRWKLINYLRYLLWRTDVINSGLFDEDYYLSQYKDVAKAKASPIRHFMMYGGKQGRNPSEQFDTGFYLKTYPDVAASGMNPLLHYLRVGKAEGRKTRLPEPEPEPVHVPLAKRKSATLIFDHNYGGGTRTYVYSELINHSISTQNSAVLLTRYSPSDRTYLVEVRKNSNVIEKNSYKNADKYFAELAESDYASIVVNSLYAWPSVKEVLSWIAEYKKSNPSVVVEYKGHDYYCVCPSFTLQDETHHYCGIRNDETGCDVCVHALRGNHVFLDNDNKKKYSVTNWRNIWNSFLTDTVDVFEVFSQSSQKIFTQAYPDTVSKMRLVPHKIPSFKRYNIATLGNLSLHKGATVVRRLCEYADMNHITDIQLHLFGHNSDNIDSSHLTDTGVYERQDLPEKLRKANIDLIFIPSTCPETFCYTAGEAIALGYPVACFDIGGQADQVRNYSNGIILYNEDPAYLYKTFKEVCSSLQTCTNCERNAETDSQTKTVVVQDMAGREFLKWMYEQREDKSKFVPEAESDIQITDEMPKVIAAYLPQFYDFPEKTKWFGKGYSEWTNSAQALPQFLGHRQPHTPIDVGFYNLNTSKVMYRQAELAKKYGVAGFCVYYYWFSGKKLMDQPLQNILADKNLDFPFFLFWANDDLSMCCGNGATREVLYRGALQSRDADSFMEDILPYMKDPRYIKIHNKPVLLIYKIALSLKTEYLGFVERIQEIAVQNGFDGLYLLSPIEDFMDHKNLESVQKEYKLDALIEFHPIAGRKGWTLKHEDYFDPACRSTCYDVDDFVQNKKYTLDTKANIFPGLFPNWDNTSGRYNRSTWILQNSPENYKQWLADLIQWTKEHNNPDERFVFVNAWNEWENGAHLEPDTYYGYAYLQKTRDALEETSRGNPLKDL